MNDENKLKEILKGNPFLSVADSWQVQMLKSAACPLQNHLGQFYLLPGDEGLAKYNKEECGESRLRLEMVPQPFIGDPRADIWYVQINPGFHPIDFYDYCSIDDSVQQYVISEFISCETATFNRRRAEYLAGQRARMPPDPPVAADYHFESGDMAMEMFKKRCSYLISQLKLTVSCDSIPFYPLASCFKTLTVRGRDVETGVRAWWCNALCIESQNAIFADVFRECGNDALRMSSEIGKRLFVIENFPYHSKRFDRDRYSYHKEHPYRKFVSKLLKYAVMNEKKILFRSQREFDVTSESMRELGCDLIDHSFLLGNAQRVWLTTNTLRPRSGDGRNTNNQVGKVPFQRKCRVLANMKGGSTTHRRDTTKYNFDGRQRLRQQEMVEAVIAKHITTHPGISLIELMEAFPRELQGPRLGCVVPVASELFRQTRRCSFRETTYTLDDGTEIAIVSEWGRAHGEGNIPAFFARAHELGYQVEEVVPPAE